MPPLDPLHPSWGRLETYSAKTNWFVWLGFEAGYLGAIRFQKVNGRKDLDPSMPHFHRWLQKRVGHLGDDAVNYGWEDVPNFRGYPIGAVRALSRK